MTPRVALLAIREAAQNGDVETLAALLNRHEALLADFDSQEAREAIKVLEEAEHVVRLHMKDIQKELGAIRAQDRGAKRYRTAA